MRGLSFSVLLVAFISSVYAQENPKPKELTFCYRPLLEKDDEPPLRIGLSRFLPLGAGLTEAEVKKREEQRAKDIQTLWDRIEKDDTFSSVNSSFKLRDFSFSIEERPSVYVSGSISNFDISKFRKNGFRCAEFEAEEFLRPQIREEATCSDPLDFTQDILGLTTYRSFRIESPEASDSIIRFRTRLSADSLFKSVDEMTPKERAELRQFADLANQIDYLTPARESEEQKLFSSFSRGLGSFIERQEKERDRPNPTQDELRRKVFDDTFDSITQALNEDTFTPTLILGQRGDKSRIGAGFAVAGDWLRGRTQIGFAFGAEGSAGQALDTTGDLEKLLDKYKGAFFTTECRREFSRGNNLLFQIDLSSSPREFGGRDVDCFGFVGLSHSF